MVPPSIVATTMHWINSVTQPASNRSLILRVQPHMQQNKHQDVHANALVNVLSIKGPDYRSAQLLIRRSPRASGLSVSACHVQRSLLIVPFPTVHRTHSCDRSLAITSAVRSDDLFRVVVSR
jgi:hypothetical protein